MYFTKGIEPLIYLLCLDIQGRAEPQDEMPQVQRDKRFQELFLDSATRGGRFASSNLQRGTVLSFNKNKSYVFFILHEKRTCRMSKYSVFAGERAEGVLQGRKNLRGQQDVLRPVQ